VKTLLLLWTCAAPNSCGGPCGVTVLGCIDMDMDMDMGRFMDSVRDVREATDCDGKTAPVLVAGGARL
jgi:hypothetical protein